MLDNWIDKWGYIIRSIRKKTDNTYFDLSGGFDTRTVLSIMLSSGVDINNISIRSAKDKVHGHDEDLMIANNISLKFGFKLNNLTLDNNFTDLSAKDTIFCTLYTKLGFHKEFYLKNKFFNKPRYAFTGGGGEYIRGSPYCPINKFIEILSSKGNEIVGNGEKFYKSSKRICQKNVDILKKERKYNNDFEISSDFYSGILKNHFGKLAVEGFLANLYFLQPLIDPDLRKLKFDVIGKERHDLVTYIYVRYAHDLIYFPFQGNRSLFPESIKKAKRLNNKLSKYIIKSDYNENFFIDDKRKSPIPSLSIDKKNAINYFNELFKSSKFISIISKIYDKNVIKWARDYSEQSNFFPLRHYYALLAIAITIKELELNKLYMEKHDNMDNFGKGVLNEFFK